LFDEFDYVPLASASIAQVHKARLSSGQAVAVKIQHSGVAAVFLADMARSIKIARVCAWLNSDFETMLTVLTSWEKEIHYELDFEHEVENIRLIRASLLDKHGANVCVPAVIDALVSKRVFAMEFVEDSFKIDDVFQLSYHGVNKLELMRLVVHVWCTMLFRINAVNADPHPGNLHVRLSPDGTVQPVLLDWGWVVRLSPDELGGWRGLVVALSEMDMRGASKALQALGYRNNQDDRAPERSVEFFAYLMRDTSGAKQAKIESKEFFKVPNVSLI
jgi:predicted unusual protein kinase regulating ubiquinone biosynthesis (AarF/ABC1/UbiB family)